MSNEPTLFDQVADTRHGHLGERLWVTTPRARMDDPDTSHGAAASVRAVSVTQDRILNILRMYGPLTDEQILAWYDTRRAVTGWPEVSPSGMRSRRAELVDQGRVRAAAEKGTTVSGRSCHKWEAAV